MINELNSKHIETSIKDVCCKCWLEARQATYNKWPIDWHVSSYRKWICDLCKKETMITQTRDFGYPDFNLITTEDVK